MKTRTVQNEMVRTGWKVLSVEDGRYFPAFVRCICVALLVYLPDVWVLPLEQCGPLSLFDTKRHADAFAHYMSKFYGFYGRAKYTVRKCEYAKSDETELYHCRKRSSLLLTACPPGTILASKIKILEG